MPIRQRVHHAQPHFAARHSDSEGTDDSGLPLAVTLRRPARLDSGMLTTKHSPALLRPRRSKARLHNPQTIYCITVAQEGMCFNGLSAVHSRRQFLEWSRSQGRRVRAPVRGRKPEWSRRCPKHHRSKNLYRLTRATTDILRALLPILGQEICWR
jgi:hypothetical protein